MADTVAIETQEIKTEKRFDLDKMDYVQVPVKNEEKKDEVKDEIKDETKELELDKIPEVTLEEQIDDTKDKTEEKDSTEDKKADDEGVSADDFIKSQYGEKYEIESKEALDEILEHLPSIIDENENLKKQLSERSDEPTFKSESQKKLWNFLQPYAELDNIPEGMMTFARVTTMDLANADPKLVLETEYVMNHPELTQEEASRKFNRDFIKKYSVKEEDFESKEEAKAEEEDRKLDLKSDYAKAKKFIEQKQVEYKTKPKEESKKIDNNDAVISGISANTAQLSGFMGEFQELTFSPSDNEEDDFSYKFTKDQLKTIHDATKAWVGNPASYDAKGKVVGGFNVEEKTKQVAYLLYADEIIDAVYKRAMSMADIKRAEQIAKVQPNREAKVAGGKPNGQLSEEKQQQMLIEKRKANSGKKSQVYIQ